MAKIKIEKGIIMPDKNSVVELLMEIKSEIKDNKKLANLLKKKPAEYLSSVGLNEDVRLELLKASNLSSTAMKKSCVFTCWKSCWITEINCGGCTLVTVNSSKKVELNKINR